MIGYQGLLLLQPQQHLCNPWPCFTLGLCMDPNAAESVSPDIRQAVTSEFIKLETTLEDGENPIERLEVVCSESQGIVNLDVIPSAEQADFEAANGGGGVLGVGGGGGSNAAAMQWQHVIYAKINSTQTKVTEIEDFQVSKLTQLENWIQHIKQMTHALSVAPAQIICQGGWRAKI